METSGFQMKWCSLPIFSDQGASAFNSHFKNSKLIIFRNHAFNASNLKKFRLMLIWIIFRNLKNIFFMQKKFALN